ncbi:MAG TPA: hypothetical protein VFD49_12820 [Candidatus Dormibacteraeota bacterium]|nr:hypothetical protein [Candidatus Dormibacteraeota bacterium]
MDFLDALLGRTRLPRPDEERLFAMSTAVVGLEAAGLRPAGRAGIVVRRLAPGRFDQLEAELRQLLSLLDEEGRPTVEVQRDELGFDWLVLAGGGFQESLVGLHAVATRFLEEGLGDLLLAAVIRFDQSGRSVYWIYAYRRARFYPFVPVGERRRDNAEELRLAALAGEELPVEEEMDRWYPLWGLPV